MALSYGQIGDRLSDLVAEIEEMNEDTSDFHKQSELARVIGEINNVRERCDSLSFGLSVS